jgi:asparagine synthase (glutamine-hydrolysing)
MCGVAGAVSFGGGGHDPGLLGRMLESISHRGPDDRGQYGDRHAVLGHARLSVIDVEGGHQPMSNPEGTLWMTFNGEIFNYVELRKELVQQGHRFRTQSDTEVLLRLYEAEGEACVRRLNGQWAFAIWDTIRRRLFISRDRIGVRPLYYTVTGETFLFASEVKALLAHPAVERQIDLRALQQIFTFWSPLPPRTIFKSICELPPGHSLTVEDGQVRLERYWALDYSADAGATTESDTADQLRELLIDATRIRLRSDVPVGAYLSGGLDSTIVTTIIRRFTDAPLRTFSVVFDDPEFDERRYQQDVIDFLSADHDRVHCTSDDIARVFPEVVWHAERPLLRTAPAPLYLLAGLVRSRGYKVVLTGEGADEMLGGYDIFKEAKIRRFWARQPQSVFRPLLLKRLYPYLQHMQSQSSAYLEAFFRVRPEDLASPFFSHLPRWELTSRLTAFFSDDVKAALAGYDPCEELEAGLPAGFAGWDAFQQAQYLETAHLLPGYILSSQGDRVAMAHAVEGRFPFLDHRVVEFTSGLPARLKMRGLNEKYVLKRAFDGLIPASVQRRPKQPYRAPEAATFFRPSNGLPDYVESMLAPDRIRQDGLFHSGAVQHLVAKAKSGRAIGIKDNMALLGILSTQLLVEQFVNHNRYISHAAIN